MQITRCINPRLFARTANSIHNSQRLHQRNIGTNPEAAHGRAGNVQTTPEDAPAGKLGPTGMIRDQSPAEAAPKPLSYNVAVDYRTSTFAPVPSRVMDGSEGGDAIPAAITSGAPVELQARTVRIYRPSKSATQSGDWQGHHWKMDWDILGKGHRWENPLMGWQSSADFMQGTSMFFRSRDEAIAFANKQGYEYFVQEPNERKFVPKAYASQFMHSPKRLKVVGTK